ncbi:MAG: dTDP-glucose 4,6-dehydratase [Vicinamibacterales bacterium]
MTGGAGFIGSNFVRHALAHVSTPIVVVDKLTYAGSLLNLAGVLDDARVTFVQADIADRDAMAALFGQHRPSAVVNFAAETHVDRSIDGPAPFIDTNIVGTFVLLECALALVRTMPAPERDTFRFLHISTDEVYGTLGAEGLFSETTPYAPNSPYAASKASADHLVRAYYHTYGLRTIITNCSNNYGPYQFPEKLIPLMILNALDGRALPIYGDGGNVRDWLHVEDHCGGVLTALQRGTPGEKYNIGGNSERTNLQVIEALCSALEAVVPSAQNRALAGRRYVDLRTFVPDRPGHDRRYAIDASKMQRELGWSPRHDFESGIRATVQWYVDNREWCRSVQSGQYDRERLGLR